MLYTTMNVKMQWFCRFSPGNSRQIQHHSSAAAETIHLLQISHNCYGTASKKTTLNSVSCELSCCFSFFLSLWVV